MLRSLDRSVTLHLQGFIVLRLLSFHVHAFCGLNFISLCCSCKSHTYLFVYCCLYVRCLLTVTTMRWQQTLWEEQSWKKNEYSVVLASEDSSHWTAVLLLPVLSRREMLAFQHEPGYYEMVSLIYVVYELELFARKKREPEDMFSLNPTRVIHWWNGLAFSSARTFLTYMIFQWLHPRFHPCSTTWRQKPHKVCMGIVLNKLIAATEASSRWVSPQSNRWNSAHIVHTFLQNWFQRVTIWTFWFGRQSHSTPQ